MTAQRMTIDQNIFISYMDLSNRGEQRKAFFFDRDGIVNERIMGGYVTRVEEFVFLPDFFSFFQAVKEAGYLTVIITNQQGVGKGLMTEQELGTIHAWMQEELLRRTGYTFDDIFICTDLASRENNCRKPNPVMLLQAIEKWHVDPTQSWMIGDSISDVEAGFRAGVPGILVGDFIQNEIPSHVRYVFPHLPAAAMKLRYVMFFPKIV